MLYKAQQLKLAPGAGAASIATQINAFFTSVGSIDLQDIQFYHDEPMQVQGAHVLVSFRDPGSVATYAAVSFIATAAATAAALANAFFAANPAARPVALLDVTEERRRFTRRESLVVVYTPGYETPCGAGLNYPRIVRAVGAIASGAAGTAALMTTAGEVGADTISLTNRFDFTWPDNEEGWAVRDPADCSWIGFPTCCSAPP